MSSEISDPIVDKIIEKFDTFGINSHSLPNAIGMWPEEQECFVWTALQANPNTEGIEITSFCGGSAVLLGLAREYLPCITYSNGVGTPDEYCKIYCVDLQFNEMFDRNIKRFAPSKRPFKIQCNSRDLGSQYFYKKIGLLFIDGFHSYKQAMTDFLVMEQKLSDDAFVMLHDVSPYIYDEEYLKNKFQYTMDNLDDLVEDKNENFKLDEVVSYLVYNRKYELIKPPIWKLGSHLQETGLTEWKRGTTSPFNSLAILRKTI